MLEPADKFPVKPHDWVCKRNSPGDVAKVRDVYRDESGVLVDLVLYSRSGDRIGRESPALDGPKNFEPCCPYAGWQRIEKPNFPIVLCRVEIPGGGVILQYHHNGNALADRNWSRPLVRARVVAAVATSVNYNPDFHRSALLLAAQELRDAAKDLGIPGLIDRAVVLERKAAAASKPL